jgi:hypothetical protein
VIVLGVAVGTSGPRLATAVSTSSFSPRLPIHAGEIYESMCCFNVRQLANLKV